MADSARRKPSSQTRKFSCCCSSSGHPHSPENTIIIAKKIHKKHDFFSKPTSNSVPNSPVNSKSGLNFVGKIDPRRILSPGRVSPLDSDPTAVASIHEPSRVVDSALKLRSEPFPGKDESSLSHPGSGSEQCGDMFDVRLNLRGKNGGALVLETSSEVLLANSEVFAGLISEYRKGLRSTGDSNVSNASSKMCRIEVPDVDNLGVFRDTIELMFEDNITKRLLKIGVYRAIDILEVSASIMFTKGVSSCLKYLEAVPWTEEEEQKLRGLFSVFKFEDTESGDILARLYLHNSVDCQQNLGRQLVWSVTTCTYTNARNELKSLVKSLFCRSSMHEKYHPELNKEDLYIVCQSCLSSLVNLLEEATNTSPNRKATKRETGKPLIERISQQVGNINWLLEILLDQQMGEKFVDMWADQGELLKLHEDTSPMIRYELSRISATLIIAMGTRKLHCHSDARTGFLQAWFHPMLSDFGWLRRCKKELDMKALEEAMGQTLLTLPRKQQHTLFMEWFRCFSKRGTECPNLSKAFQIWWRRSFLRGSENNAVEFRLTV
ncbi:hypothetical protein MANES_12G154700v8 [Manihot esculenta]|uniref:Uncharacterized protein n=1 Tax=Manihot esculenta TaxID=3983 RepID=A0ACB7GU26_MANES|nr:hypothetical protein MANES_12G154700v8 [Manihot esculenta]